MRQRSSYPKPFKAQVVQKAQCGNRSVSTIRGVTEILD
ncbi:hypothetical protein [Pseudomonas sp. 24 E 1]|nr:hypothetical protein [Pseudomonas sp. 52 E 6]CRM51762.1 hypothetical protein [Pseudomonas sp. 24 E 1]CRM62186.1 hypothetical protein [Pseudomonas sp. 24 R 17]CRM67760.1 hypothetical protein [Pseudomonas sp. 35 E 8]CRM71552.1 hypothetical protein [Pseudomonas sp. 58 R 12]SFU41547.1 hypothetical protein SAMN05428951_101500 [Pseudomonas sp. OV546]